MCGLFGHSVQGKWDQHQSLTALETLAHRGPDNRSHWVDSAVFSGQSRLSIIDLSDRGSQPMRDEGESCIISVNGEIYNFVDLRAQLEIYHRFTSDSDSEVVLHGYKQWGFNGLLDRLEGMYALTIYDVTKRMLYLARDRVGVKPLYTGFVNGEFAWASELKALETYFGRAQMTTDYTAVYDFLTYRYVPSPKSLYREVRKLPPGHAMSFDLANREQKIWRYWALEVAENKALTLDAASTQMQDLLAKNVANQMVADVPVGFFLSGGVDSAAVVAAASVDRSGLQTHFIDFEGDPPDERRFSTTIANACRTNHSATTLTRATAEDLFASVRGWYDEPFADSSSIPTFLVSSLASKTATVVLTGDGGDEVFGGYEWYDSIPARNVGYGDPGTDVPWALRALKRACRKSLVGKALQRIEQKRYLSGYPLHLRMFGGMLRDEKASYKNHWEIPADYDDFWFFRQYDRPELPLRTRLQYVDFHTFLPDDVLTKVDRASMAASIEVRVPLLATRIVEFGFSLPEDIRYHNGRLKGLFKHALKGMLPNEVLERPKRGFGIPPRTLTQALWADHSTRQERILRELFPELLGSIR